VHNQNYKAFDGVQNLKVGDTVSVYSGSLEYRYSVTGMKVADATEDVVELPSAGKHLVLVTCDSFAQKTNRFVVTADFVGTYSLGN
jgi:LPXTG-site transpeptidase (sortase) family protein